MNYGSIHPKTNKDLCDDIILVVVEHAFLVKEASPLKASSHAMLF